MRDERVISGTVIVINREKSSVNGNPRFRVQLAPSDGSPVMDCLTKPDAAVAYGIQNRENAEQARDWIVGEYYGRLHISDC